MHTSQISDLPQGGNDLLKLMILRCSEEARLCGRKESSFGKLIRSHEGGFNKPLKNQSICND